MGKANGVAHKSSGAEQLFEPATAAQLASSLSTSSTVARQLVHKAAVSEVFVTDVQRVSSETFVVAVQWPRWHGYFRPTPDLPAHPLLFVESLRQGGILISHQFLDFPSTAHLLFEKIEVNYLGIDSFLFQPSPPNIILVIRVSRSSGGARASRVSLVIEGWSGADCFATARVNYRGLSAGSYARVRGGRLPGMALGHSDSVPASTVDSGCAGTERQLLAVDYYHPTFFDHPVDHLPGMLLMDAMLRGAGIESPTSWRDLQGFDVVFQRYAELYGQTTVTRLKTEAPEEEVTVLVEQGRNAIASGIVKRR